MTQPLRRQMAGWGTVLFVSGCRRLPVLLFEVFSELLLRHTVDLPSPVGMDEPEEPVFMVTVGVWRGGSLLSVPDDLVDVVGMVPTSTNDENMSWTVGWCPGRGDVNVHECLLVCGQNY